MLLGICHPLDVLGEGCSLLGLRSLLLRRQFASWKRSNHCCRWRRGCGRCPRSALNRELWGGVLEPVEAQMMGVSLSKSIMVMEGVIYVFFILFFVWMGC